MNVLPGSEMETVGDLSFHRSSCVGAGKFGTVFHGQYKNETTVAVKRFFKRQTRIDTSLYLQLNVPHLIGYFCTDETSDIEFM